MLHVFTTSWIYRCAGDKICAIRRNVTPTFSFLETNIHDGPQIYGLFEKPFVNIVEQVQMEKWNDDNDEYFSILIA